jgi:hypothetical protein
MDYFCNMKFKKYISFILAFFVLVTNSGLAFNVHFCEGKIATVSSVFSKEEVCEMPVILAEKKCCAEKAKTHESCCKDKVLSLLDKADDSIIKIASFNLAISSLIEKWKPTVFPSIPNFKSRQITFYCCDANAPPFFKLYNQYIFYA